MSTGVMALREPEVLGASVIQENARADAFADNGARIFLLRGSLNNARITS